MKNQMNRNKGFSFIEMLIAITILSVIMIMVTQFMGTTSVTITKTQKNLNIQTEAMEVGEQVTDTLVQATYIRVEAMDNETYTLNTDLTNGKERYSDEFATMTSYLIDDDTDVGNDWYDLVVDNYPNYATVGETGRKIVYNKDTFKLVKDSNVSETYPLSGDGDSEAVCSFRFLTSKDPGNTLYVMPRYIYIRYQSKASGTEVENYALFYFVKDAKTNLYKVYVARDAFTTLAGVTGDGFAQAKTKMNALLSNDENQGLLTDHVVNCYFTADSDANTLSLDMLYEDDKFKGYTYNYVETITLRNSNVLTVPPQKLFKTK